MFRKKILVGSITATLLLTSGISVALADTNLDDFNVEPFGTTWQSFALTVPGNNVNPEFRKPVFTVNMLQIRVDRVVNY